MSATRLSEPAVSQTPPAAVGEGENGRAAEVAGGDLGRVLASRHRWYLPIKATVEYILAVILFVAAIPFLIVAALLIKLTSPGPVFYLQTRLGKNRRRFRLIKLRTMIHNAERHTGPVWSGRSDSRVTRVGRMLRSTHIDEFPQLINVLWGQMSLIGPRPERPEIVEQLEWQIPRYSQRLSVRPGITGLAQLNLPPDCSLRSVRRKLLHDLYYIRYLSPWLDAKIFFVTAWLLTKTLIKSAFRFARLPNSERVHSQIASIVGHDSELLRGLSEEEPAGEVSIRPA